MDEALLRRAVEALLFAADEPLSAATLADVVAEVTGEANLDVARVEAAVEALDADLRAAGRPLRVERWAGGYRLATVPEVAPFLKALLEGDRTRRLSKSLLETLAVVAYQQPVSKAEIDFVRGVNTDYALRRLLELRFVAVVGRGEGVGRPLLYGTTPEFLERFGLERLEDLPRPREIEELLADPAFTRERAELLAALGPDAARPTPSSDGQAQA